MLLSLEEVEIINTMTTKINKYSVVFVVVFKSLAVGFLANSVNRFRKSGSSDAYITYLVILWEGNLALSLYTLVTVFGANEIVCLLKWSGKKVQRGWGISKQHVKY